MLHCYGAFLTDVMNDEDGENLQEKAKAIESQNLNKMIMGEDELLEDCVIRSVNDKSLAMI